MKAILKHVANQYILIVDEEPNIGDWYFSTNTNKIKKYKDWFSFPAWRKVIAAENLKGVKEIKYKLDDRLTIYQKGDVIMRSIDTEVEVTEEKNYWVVRL